MANPVDIYSVLDGLTPDPDEIQEAEVFAQQYLKAQFPDIDLRVGTGVRDLVIRPTASLIALLNKGLVEYFSSNTLEGVTDQSPRDKVDAIMSNFFLERKEGTKAVLNVRLFFAIRKTVTLPSATTFSPDDNLSYSPLSTTVITPNQMLFDSDTQEYFVDVNLMSEQASEEYNIQEGSMLFFTTFDTFFLRADINFLVTPAVPPETNTQFLDRAPSSISTRNLINQPSIESNLTDNFPSIKTVVTVGLGDPEMIRDEVTVLDPATDSPGSLHIGGKVDVYCRTPIQTNINQYRLDDKGDLELVGPIFKVDKVNLDTNGEPDTLPSAEWPPTFNYLGRNSSGELTQPSLDVGFSSQQRTTLSFGAAQANKTVTLSTSFFSLLPSVQSYLDTSKNRVVCGDYLARGFNFYWLDVEAVSYTNSSITTKELRPVVQEYLLNLSPGEAFVMSDIINELSDAGYPKIKTPLNVSYKFYDRNYGVSSGTIEDYLDPEDRTAIFILKSLTISSI